ncbi:uroporphyrinogen-III synthase [Halarcobacter mediterraneus]|uniref:Uroporphyrinogen-III synthase n=1 Tax=Halarcobacter mediterraneus TaxID=2023153 RepID=A0A4Q1B2U4_9BACT|nr:uroporphyrinogen-III synthase [Halarcobacter mediterraneus]RXK13115.1 uroporphyrinogen-III synthase [Halarcobacter mediterraneus]
MNIKKLIDSLDLIYYEYNPKTNIIKVDNSYSNFHTQREFTKITFYLSKKHIKFDVLGDKSILVNSKNSIPCKIKRAYKSFVEDLKNKNKNIYVLSNKKVKWAKNIPLFEIKYIKKDIYLDNYDALIFTSKSAINSINSFNKDWKKLPSYVISYQSAKLVKSLNGNLKFIGKEKHGDKFALEIAEELKGKRVLYLRGEKVISDLVNILNSKGVTCEEISIYENNYKKPDKNISLPKNSKIIFSSPSTIEYFLKNFKWKDTYHAISIGNTTAKHFPDYIKPIIADDTSIEACVQKAVEIDS